MRVCCALWGRNDAGLGESQGRYTGKLPRVKVAPCDKDGYGNDDSNNPHPGLTTYFLGRADNTTARRADSRAIRNYASTTAASHEKFPRIAVGRSALPNSDAESCSDARISSTKNPAGCRGARCGGVSLEPYEGTRQFQFLCSNANHVLAKGQYVAVSVSNPGTGWNQSGAPPIRIVKVALRACPAPSRACDA